MMVHIFKFLSSPGPKPPRPNPYQVPISFKTQLNLKEYFNRPLGLTLSTPSSSGPQTLSSLTKPQ